MIGDKFLLDTNIVVDWLRGEAAVAGHIDNAKEIFIPLIVIGELYYGAFYAKDVEKEIKVVRDIADKYDILYLDDDTAFTYGKIKADLRKKGKPIPENDIWIGAIAMQHNLTVVTRGKHFNEIYGLKITQW
jgi:tRNA(fMet)-specific endonuclease VapC